jgi:hypothetical protein
VAASTYKVNTDAIALEVKQEFAAKAMTKKKVKPVPRTKKAAWSRSNRRAANVSPFGFFQASQSRKENPLWFLPAPTSRYSSGLPSPVRGRSRVPPPAPSPDGGMQAQLSAD